MASGVYPTRVAPNEPRPLPGNPGGRPNPATPARDTTWSILTTAAKNNGIPAWMLVGVFGAESSFGKSTNWFGLGTPGGVPRSTNGAGGRPTFSGDADIAAKTLRRLLNYHPGDTEAALQAYSGNGYSTVGAQHNYKSATDYIKGLAGQAPTHVDQTASPIEKLAAGPAGDAAQAVVDAAAVPGKFLVLITSLEFWLRLGEGIAGLVLLAMGLKSLGAPVPNPARALPISRAL